MKRHDSELSTFDLYHMAVHRQNADAWFHRKMVKDVEPLTEQVFQVYNDIGIPVIICFVYLGDDGVSSPDDDSKKLKVKFYNEEERDKAIDESQQLLNRVLPKLAKEVYKGFVICYADITEWGDLRS